MILVYLALIELGKRRFYRLGAQDRPAVGQRPDGERRVHHRASRWSVHTRPSLGAPGTRRLARR
jgi:hypothetical protein